jgi:predicted amidophosphoribosyltransferase
VADELAAALAAGGPPGLREGAVLVPVPADPVRRSARGVDHAGLLARRLGRRTGLERSTCLRRRPAPEQVGAGRAGRGRAVRGTVAVRGSPPAVALLVDDVHTTGATLAECARALRAAGAREVRVATYSRTA